MNKYINKINKLLKIRKDTQITFKFPSSSHQVNGINMAINSK